MLLGIYKNIEELEDSICLEEVEAILTAYHQRQYDDRRFAAGLKGVDLDEISNEESESDFETIKARAEARLAGRSTEEAEFGLFGIDVE